jgi:hypothetical protein
MGLIAIESQKQLPGDKSGLHIDVLVEKHIPVISKTGVLPTDPGAPLNGLAGFSICISKSAAILLRESVFASPESQPRAKFGVMLCRFGPRRVSEVSVFCP